MSTPFKIFTFYTQKGPKAIGPYCTAKLYNGTLYISGQIGIKPEDGTLVSDKVEQQAERVMENLKIILDELKCKFQWVLKCTVYLKTMSDFDKVNNVYKNYFPHDPPSRVAIAIAELPKGALVEIDAIVACPYSSL